MNHHHLDSVAYAELTPRHFRARLAEAPVAYLPFGTLEWHGEHLPLGSDGLQSAAFFESLARSYGGIVMPMLFLGPDRRVVENGRELYGMDYCPPDRFQTYPSQQLPGSAYWVDDDTFALLVRSVLRQLRRAGFRVVVGHGHGPSTKAWIQHTPAWNAEFGLELLHCWGGPGDTDGKGIMVDHAGQNETSLMMALHPTLVRMDHLDPDPARFPVGVGRLDPRTTASAELGREILALNHPFMGERIRAALQRVSSSSAS